MRIDRYVRWIFFCCILVCYTTVSAADESFSLKTVEGIGAAKIQGSIVDTRNAAVSSGLAAAVERAALDSIPPETFSANFPAIADILSKNVNQFVQGYKVMAESRSGGFYRILVQANIFTGVIQKQLSAVGISMVDKSLPSLLLMVTEQRSSTASVQYWWADAGGGIPATESTLSRILAEKGYAIIPHDKIAATDPVLTSVHQNPEPGNSQIADIGTRAGADVVVFGTSLIQPAASTVTNLGSNAITAFVKLRALRAGTGEELAVAEQSSNAAAGAEDQAITTALTAACTDLNHQLTSAWQGQIKKAASVEVQIEGAGQLGYYSAFRTALSKISGVKDIQIKEMQAGKYILSMEYSGGARQLADILLLKTWNGFDVTIPEVGQNQMRVILGPKKP